MRPPSEGGGRSGVKAERLMVARRFALVGHLAHQFTAFVLTNEVSVRILRMQVAPVIRTVTVWCACPVPPGVGCGGAFLFELPHIVDMPREHLAPPIMVRPIDAV